MATALDHRLGVPTTAGFRQKPGMERLRRLRAAILVVVLLPSATHAAVICYDESRYPGVFRLLQTDKGVLAVPRVDGDDGQGYPLKQPAAVYNEARGWETADFTCKDWKDCNGGPTGEGFPGPEINLPVAEAVQLRPRLSHYWQGAGGDRPPDEIEQKIGAWTEHGGTIWFSLYFYDGEGSSGVGGIGRFDPATKQMVIRRPSLIRDSSSFNIVHDGQRLWLTTDAYHECSGNQTPHGLVRYDWEADRLESFEGRDDGPCGFTVHDLLLDARWLWVATDLGLSRRDRVAGTWEHFVPEPGASPPMRPTTCEPLYKKLLQSLPREESPGGVAGYSQLFESLTKFRPRFLTEYVKSLPPEKWGCDELGLLGKNAADLATLKATVIKFRPVGGEGVGCALNAFGERRPRDPEWRDLLLTLLESPKQQSDILYLLEHFAPDPKIGEVLVHRLSTADNPWQEAELLPSMIGEKSVPVLFSALERYRSGGKEHIIESLVTGLMTATHTVISPDGKETKLPPGSSPDVCVFGCPQPDGVVLRAADQWIAWWGVHKHEFEGGAGSGARGNTPDRPSKG